MKGEDMSYLDFDFPHTRFFESDLRELIKQVFIMNDLVTNFVSINAIKYADPIQWNITKSYEKNTVVIDGNSGVAYISVRPVPAGVALTREQYWTKVFDLSLFITKGAANFANTYESEPTTTATQPTNKDNWLVWDSTLYQALTDIHAGDRYVPGGNIRRMTVEDFYNILKSIIDNEVHEREAGDDALELALNEEAEIRGEADNTLHQEIVQESVDRENADTTLQDNIDAEVTARENADSAETAARENADNALQASINAETQARIDAVAAEAQARIDAITTEYNARVAADEALNARISNLSGYKDDFKNIKDYGAVGDGGLHPLSEYYNSLDDARVDFPFAASLAVSIDVAALQKAIYNNFLVYVPKGTYIFNTAVVLPQNASVTIQGEDKMHTVFKTVVSSIAMISFERVSGPSIFTLRDIQFTCETGVTGVTAIYFHGLIDGSTRYEDNWITVQRCNFYDLNRAMDLYTCSNIYVDHCYAVRTQIFAYLGRAASFAHFSNILTLLGWATIYAEDALEDGISNGLYCYDVIGVFNSNLTFRVHGWQAVYIQNCSADFQSGVDGGYFIYGCQDVTINGCWCAGTDIMDSYGIRLWNCYNAHVSDCTIEHFRIGIRCDSPAYGGITISHNTFIANSWVDVQVVAGSGTIIDGNTFRSGATPIKGYESTTKNCVVNNIMIGTAYDMTIGDSVIANNVYI